MTAERNEPSLEQRILGAAEKYEREEDGGIDLFHPADIKALLEEKNRERDEWKRIAESYQKEHVRNAAWAQNNTADALTGKGKP